MALNIKQKFFQLYTHEFFPILIFGIVFFIIIQGVGFFGDDILFRNALPTADLFPFLVQRYFTWSNRIPAEFMLAIINFHDPLWKIVNSLMAALLTICISKYSTVFIESNEIRRSINIFICCSIFFIQLRTLTDGMIWYSVSFNYLWATVASLMTLLPFFYSIIYKEFKINIVFTLIIYISAIYSSFVKQTAIVLLIFGAFSLVYIRISSKALPPKLIALYLFISINCFISFLSPGIRIRMNEEIYNWYPNFPMVTVTDKIFQAVNWINQHILVNSYLLFFIFSILIFAVFLIKYANRKLLLLASALPMFFSGMRLIVKFRLVSRILKLNIETSLEKIFFTPFTANVSIKNINFEQILPSIFCFIVILLSGILLWFVFDKTELKLTSIIFYLVSLSTGYMLAFSPTIFASSYRVFYIGDILLLLVSGLIFREFLTFTYPNIKKYIVPLHMGYILISVSRIIPIVRYISEKQFE